MYRYIELHMAIKRDDKKRAKALIEKGNNLNVQDIEGKTPLHISLEYKNFDIANMLLQKNVELDLMDDMKKTPLHIAVEVNKEIAIKIIQMGANINIQDDFKETPLHTAIRLGKKEIAKILISNGANYNLKDEDGESTLDLIKRRGYSDILEQIEKQKEKQKEKRDLKLHEYFHKIKKDDAMVSKLTEPNKSILKYLQIKLGYKIKDFIPDRLMSDILWLYTYNRQKIAKIANYKTNYKEITQWDIDRIIWRKPVYIRGICGLSKTCDSLELRGKNKGVKIELKKLKRNETGIDLELRKLKRRKGEATLTKVEGTKDGNINRCFSMINFGRIIPLYNVGYGTFGQQEEKIKYVAKRDVGSFVNKEQGIVEKHGEHKRVRKNKGIKHDLAKMISYLRKNTRLTGNNEIMMDVTDDDVKFIYYFKGKKGKDITKLKAAYARKKFEISTGRTLPIFEYKLSRIRCLKEKALDKREVLDLLKSELTKNKESYTKELDLLLVFKDEIKSMPNIEKIVKDIICENMGNKENNIYDVINISKLVGGYFGKSQKKEYLDSHLKQELCEDTMNNFIKYITKDSSLYRHKRQNREIDLKLEVLSECRAEYQKLIKE